MIQDTTERWVRSTKKHGLPNAWHRVDGVEEYNADVLILRCSKRMRVAQVEQTTTPNPNLLCVMCERYANAHAPHKKILGSGNIHSGYRDAKARATLRGRR